MSASKVVLLPNSQPSNKPVQQLTGLLDPQGIAVDSVAGLYMGMYGPVYVHVRVCVCVCVCVSVSASVSVSE